MKKLVKKLNEAAKAYYSENENIMTDYEYDRLYDKLKKMEEETGIVLPESPTLRIGYEVVSSLPKHTHKYPALSLEKTKIPEELVKWANGKATVLSWKEDGLTLVATYSNGKQISAATRGNGYVGEDVTHNAPYIEGLPQEIPFQHELVVRGEVLIGYEDFNRINADGEYANPRNLAASSLRALDSYVAANRKLHFKAFSIGSDCAYRSYHEQLNFLDSLGFDCVESVFIDSPASIPKAIKEFEENISNYDFPTDGLVLTFNDIDYGESLGMTGKFPRHSIAFKWKDETVETTLRSVEWSPSRTGLINPVAIFDPIELEGTVVRRASIHNIRYLKDLYIGIGDTITVYKANMIIPQIAENLSKNGNLIQIPKHCPVCGALTEIRTNADNTSESLYCTNPECIVKHAGKFTRLVERDALNVIGVSKSTIEQLVTKGMLHEMKDLYHLKLHKDEIIEMDGFGEKSFQKMIEAVESSRNTTFRQLFYSLGIPGVGHDASKILEKEFTVKKQYEHMTKTDALKYMIHLDNALDVLTDIDGIGTVNASALLVWFDNHEREFDDLLHELVITDNIIEKQDVSSQDLNGMTFVITGSLETYSNRNELKKEIESRGGKVSGSVSKKTTYLISNEDSSSSKSVKAKELDVKIITEAEYKKF